jgi:hypothetical protein
LNALKRATTVLLLLFVAASVGTLIAKETSRREPDRVSASAIPVVVDPDRAEGPCRVIACYFHNTDRCSTCLQIEQAARETVEEAFAVELASGRLTWMTLNMEESQNRAYIAQFDLARPTLVVMRLRGETIERWSPLDDTWGLIRNSVKFSLYVKDNVSRLLEGCS